MKILTVWPPHIPSYFNAGHHLAVYTTAMHLRNVFSDSHVKTAEYGLLNKNWKEIGEDIYQFNPDYIIIINDFDNVDNLDRFIAYIRELTTHCRIITGGRLSTESPSAFRQYDLDGIVIEGDIEIGFEKYIQHHESKSFNKKISGVNFRTRNGIWIEASPGERFLPGAWPLPDVAEIPYDYYDNMYSRDQNKFCGIPGRRELVVPVGRGCPINCSFCEVPSVQGLRDRRISPKKVIEYIEYAQNVVPFDYVSFYAPTFTFNRKWVLELCKQMALSDHPLPWKCATAIPHLDEELMREMSKAGCIRISVGLETLEESGLESLPRKKRTNILRFDELNKLAGELGIEMNFFIMVGLPGTTIKGTAETIAMARTAGARVRPTVYSDIVSLRSTQTKNKLWKFNRQILFSAKQESYTWYKFFFGYDGYITKVADKIPSKWKR